MNNIAWYRINGISKVPQSLCKLIEGMYFKWVKPILMEEQYKLILECSREVCLPITGVWNTMLNRDFLYLGENLRKVAIYTIDESESRGSYTAILTHVVSKLNWSRSL